MVAESGGTQNGGGAFSRAAHAQMTPRAGDKQGEDQQTTESGETRRRGSAAGSILSRLLKQEMDDLRSPEFWRAVVAEFLGVLLLVFFAVGSGLHEEGTRGPGSVHQILAGGFYIAVIISSLLRCSGAHVNPAVSLGLALTRNCSVVRFLVYTGAQTAGSIAGAALINAVTPDSKLGRLGLVLPAKNVSVEQALFCEFIITFFLLFVIISLIDKGREDVGTKMPIVVGLTVCVNIFYAGHVSGAAMNPARAVGPAVITGHLESHWIYWVGPLLGGAAGALLYNTIFSTNASCLSIKKCLLSTDSYDNVSTIDPDHAIEEKGGNHHLLEPMEKKELLPLHRAGAAPHSKSLEHIS